MMNEKVIIFKQKFLGEINKIIDIKIEPRDILFYKTRRWAFWVAFPFMMLMSLWAYIKTFVYILIGRKVKIQKRLLPKNPSLFWSGLSSACNDIKKYAKTFRALDIVYNYKDKIAPNLRGIDRFVSDFWLEWVMLNPGAVKNRLKLVERELYFEIKKLSKKNVEPIRLLSIASGSAEGVLNVIARYERESVIEITATLFDLDHNALEFSKRIAEEKKIKCPIKTIRGSTKNLLDYFSAEKFHIIEMVGFLDYKTSEGGIKLIERIKSLLLPDGVLICCNIVPNPESLFMSQVVLWPMIYKTPHEQGNIIIKAGFKKVNIIVEPQKIHAISIAYNNSCKIGQ